MIPWNFLPTKTFASRGWLQDEWTGGKNPKELEGKVI